MITCEPSASAIVAPARSAMERITSVPAALSPVATTVQAGEDFQAGRPDEPDDVRGIGRGIGDHRTSVGVADGKHGPGKLLTSLARVHLPRLLW
jgi:hypothetical protein